MRSNELLFAIVFGIAFASAGCGTLSNSNSTGSEARGAYMQTFTDVENANALRRSVVYTYSVMGFRVKHQSPDQRYYVMDRPMYFEESSRNVTYRMTVRVVDENKVDVLVWRRYQTANEFQKPLSFSNELIKVFSSYEPSIVETYHDILWYGEPRLNY